MLKMPAVFSDHMVLQREKPIRIFGESDAETVEIDFENFKVKLPVREGKWKAELPPSPAGGPFRLTVSTDRERLEFEDVYIGEVWLAGGQSNMEFELEKSQGAEKLLEEAGSKTEQVRFYQVSRIPYLGEELEKAEDKNRWQVYGEETMRSWSAVGFHFAREVASCLGVMVGIIGCNWGGTSASCWTSRESLLAKEATKSYVEEYDQATKGQVLEEYLKELAAYKAYQSVFERNVAEYYRTAENPTWEEALSLYGENLYPGPMGPRNERRPAGLYESMLRRVMPYQIRGFLFYQAEEDDHKPYTYQALLETLIDQWREDWMEPEMPFYYVMLPMFSDAGAPDFKNWAFLREAQIRVAGKIRNTGMANILELGEYGNIHPVRKEPVGKRLANLVLSQVYGAGERAKSCYGPKLSDVTRIGQEMHLRFVNAEALYADADRKVPYEIGQELPDFEIAGPDGNYLPAKAVLLGKKELRQEESQPAENTGTPAFTEHTVSPALTEHTGTLAYSGNSKTSGLDENTGSPVLTEIVVTNAEIKEPEFARYLFTNYAEVKIFGANGIPMEPLRTSDRDGAKATGSRQGFLA